MRIILFILIFIVGCQKETIEPEKKAPIPVIPRDIGMVSFYNNEAGAGFTVIQVKHKDSTAWQYIDTITAMEWIYPWELDTFDIYRVNNTGYEWFANFDLKYGEYTYHVKRRLLNFTQQEFEKKIMVKDSAVRVLITVK